MNNRPYQHLLAKCQDVCEKNELWKMRSEDHDAADAGDRIEVAYGSKSKKSSQYVT